MSSVHFCFDLQSPDLQFLQPSVNIKCIKCILCHIIQCFSEFFLILGINALGFQLHFWILEKQTPHVIGFDAAFCYIQKVLPALIFVSIFQT